MNRITLIYRITNFSWGALQNIIIHDICLWKYIPESAYSTLMYEITWFSKRYSIHVCSIRSMISAGFTPFPFPTRPPTCVGVIWLTSSEANDLSKVVFPALSSPSNNIRSSLSGVDLSFLNNERRPCNHTDRHQYSYTVVHNANTDRFKLNLICPHYDYSRATLKLNLKSNLFQLKNSIINSYLWLLFISIIVTNPSFFIIIINSKMVGISKLTERYFTKLSFLLLALASVWH